MSLMYSQMVPLGTPCPDFSLHGIDDQHYNLESFSDAAILVVIVMCNHCPYVQAQWDRFVELQASFADSEVQCIGINANDAKVYPEDSFDRMKSYAQKYSMNFPYLYDETQSLARALQAVCTPDIFVFDRERVLAYRGRLDDNWEDADAVQSHDLRDALTALVNGTTPSADQKPSQGCSIKWK